jgi:hypothetical protein
MDLGRELLLPPHRHWPNDGLTCGPPSASLCRHATYSDRSTSAWALEAADSSRPSNNGLTRHDFYVGFDVEYGCAIEHV